MEQSSNLSLSYVMGQQSQKHVTVNESFRRLDALVQTGVVSRSNNDAPANPEEGDIYILPAEVIDEGSPWFGFSQYALAAFQDGAWAEIIPKPGWRVFDKEHSRLVVFDQGEWREISSAGDDGNTGSAGFLPQLGINTDADESNRFAVKSDAVLFSHDDVTPGSGDLRHVFNKAAINKNASLLFQTGFSGRVELGLLGNDDFSLQVSNDGNDFNTAIKVDHVTAAVTVRNLSIAPSGGLSEISFSTNESEPFWSIGQSSDLSFFVRRLSGGFGTGGRVITYNSNGDLGLWGNPSSKGRISVRGNVNSDGVDNILYLEQTALSPASGIAQFHNNADNATPILKCTTNSRTVLQVPANGSINVSSPIQLLNASLSTLPNAVTAGAGAVIFINDAAGGGVPAFSDGSVWRRMTDRAMI